jgi:hypothetical protein
MLSLIFNEKERSMPDLDDFYNKITEMNQKSLKDLESCFENLKDYISRLEPVKLLTQLSLTFLTVPKGEFIDESHDTWKWSRWIEFLAGYLVSRNYPIESEKYIDGKTIEEVERLLDSYFQSISNYIFTSVSKKDNNLEESLLITSVKNYSLFVRGDTYPHKFFELAEDLYSHHDCWFIKNLGFTIKQAIDISISIRNEYAVMINELKDYTELEAKKHVDELIKKGKACENDRSRLEINAACYLYYGNSDSLFYFTVDELSAFSGFEKKVCERYLDRMSQEFGYRNPMFLNTFEDALSAPWDYNTLYERPIIRYEEKYFVPVFSLFPTVLFNTFHYDLLEDSSYEETYNRKRGSWLEVRTANCLRRIFPDDEILINPKYPNNEEFSDVLVLHDRKIFIINCKSKRLKYESRIGHSFTAIKEDFEKGIKDSFKQGVRARDYLNDNENSQIIANGYPLIVDINQVTNIFLMSVTLSSYQNLATRLANIEPALKLFTDNQYPWAISLFDLEIICELIDYPSVFIHYTKRRLQLEKTHFRVSADEIDLLGFYIHRGLYFKSDIFENINGLYLFSYSDEIDKFMFDKYELGKNPIKPKLKFPSGFEDYIVQVEKLESAYKTDCIMRLLDLDYQSREFFMESMEQIKDKTRNDSGLHSFSMDVKSGEFGISFVSMDAGGNIEELFRQTDAFAIMKKHKTKINEWIGFGWDLNSKKVVDVAIFLSYEPFDDPILDKIAEEKLRKGQFIEIPNDDRK